MVVELDGAPFAYVELYRAARDVIARYYPARPHDIGYHVAIGDESRTRRRLGGALFLATIRVLLYQARHPPGAPPSEGEGKTPLQHWRLQRSSG